MEPANCASPDGAAERAAQKLNLSSSPHRRKRHSSGEDEPSGPPVTFRTDYGGVIHKSPPPVPPALLRRIGVREVSGVGKVKVMLRVSGGTGPAPGTANGGSGAEGASGAAAATSSFFSIDKRRKQVTLFDPAACGGGSSAPEDRRVGVAAPKMFAFDAIFSQDDSQTEVCSSALTDVIHAVINGTDGCLFCFGHARLGKTYTMLGSADSASTLGVIPCAISWLFRGINEQKQKTGARFSVRVSAVEVTGPQDQLRDLLAGHANDSEQSPGVYLRDDPLFGTQLQNQSELRVPTAEKAAFYLDAAIALRGRGNDEMNGGSNGQNSSVSTRYDSHLLYTLHVYQYSVDKSGKGGVAGGRSRLHLIDLGSCERGKANGGIPLSGLGNVLLAIFNGQKHLPHRDSKVAQLLKECLNSLTCHAAMIAHVSPYAAHYTDTLATVQLASRIHRMRRRKIRFTGGSTGSGGSSGEENRPGIGGGPGMGTFGGHHLQDSSRSGSSDVDPSSSEQSADTVIYVGPSADDATDGEHPPVYLPSLNSGDNRCSMQKALRGSGAERRPSPSGGHRSSSASKVQQGVAKTKLNEGPSSTHSSPSRTIKSTKAAHINGRAGSPAVLSSTGIPKSPQSSRQSKSKGAAEITQSTISSNTNLPNSKMPIYNASAPGQTSTSGKGSVTGASPSPGKHSDEHWIDGPRISRSRVAEARSLMLKEGHRKKETWVDGPQAGYGFMDSHKKNMIQRWVENQTVQIQKQQMKHHNRSTVNGSSGHNDLWELADAKSSPDKKSRQYKELTVFKTCEDEGEGVTKVYNSAEQKVTDETDVMRENNAGEPSVMLADDLISEGDASNERMPQYGSDEDLEVAASAERVVVEEHREEEEDEDDGVGDIPPPLPLLHQHNKEISIDVSLDSFDVRLRILQERHGSSDIRTAGLGGEDVEIIEVEEPEEPVPMQDSCLQVTEEDIALCMGEIENPLPEVDQESQEEHPLRILSQENLTVVSTFTDSLSVTTDIERTLLSGMGDNLRQLHHHQQHIGPTGPTSSYNIFDHSRSGKVCDENLGNINGGNNCNKADFYARKFDQLAKLHELCRSVAASGTKSRDSMTTTSNLSHLPSRCQSLSLSDMLYGPRTRLGDEEVGADCIGEEYGGMCDGMQVGGGGSLYSEPVNHTSGSPPLGKICDHCKMSLRRGVGTEGTGKQWQGMNDCEVQSEGGILNMCTQSKSKAHAPNITACHSPAKAESTSPFHKAQGRSSNNNEIHRVSLAFRGFDRDSPRSSPTPTNQVSAVIDSSALNQRSNATSSPHKLLGSFSSLRHPDGASNPNLDKHSSAGMEFVEERRVPGNGQSTSDHEEEGGKVQSIRPGHKPKKTEHIKEQVKEIRREEEVMVPEGKPSGERTVMGKSDDEDNTHHKWNQPPPITTPPTPQPMPVPTPIVKAPKLSRLFGSARKSSKAALKASVTSLTTAVPTEKSEKKSRKGSGKVQTTLASSSSALEGYDSGNDSGIVSASGAVAGITSGRVSVASVITTPVHSTKLDRIPHKGSLMKGDIGAAAAQCESSGYESVLRDSECSSFGSSQELDDRASGAVAAAGGRGAEGAEGSDGGMESKAGSRGECLPLLQYCKEDVERLERRWTEQEVIRWSQIRQLRAQQQELKKELAAAKQRLLIHPSRWSYELHVEASMDYRDSSFIEALEKETVILRKRVEACKSHVLIVTCFDSIPPRTVT